MASRVQSGNSWSLKADRRENTDQNDASRIAKQTADWTAYATSYDLLADYNPAYQELVKECDEFLSGIEPPRVIFDVGGGTGTYSLLAAQKFPESAIYLIEPDQGMRMRAQEKLSGFDNITYVGTGLEDAEISVKADTIICVHSLYSMPDQTERLKNLRDFLEPGGLMFLVDLGRTMNVTDWRSYLFSHLTREYGLIKALKVFWQGREIAKQNKAIFEAQKNGLYWTHTGAELAASVENAGFEIIKQKSVYRDYSDLLLCRAAM
ncbi:class I SAM-dependent methyltransferase [Maritimibacter dapengensis]|uniref:Class I SAM-dependent methyltransferase n=1 Tax=Maritimibacter dapengensis TaxID=2836868 RepID=A0ABS6T4K5_9RHOB|nr:class I SAM-dependent methyltransferase [Maritimibacter dapengensis]MBV7380153.1 class I SAM-dependent methyltransferase [Maritimibacter dapengensis]